ncbi:hypothetical protein A2631_01960 [Candidatus Daviesbacteria bacterium RIFCSPHIGHO2_01_FULL_44_29]|uniref:Phage holin family protein n=1 Tax=Candidatus Daviesbacteria bacterium RIFCSPHIGHO2_02_FULL_43_12 TaxID=1797776 RepID=A0A1F5KKL8_9BACT|nr:MAG: hypothetical protein A2631_01960 [Candidatus Daviesbacteria bacterium RIFCSPHIGHO2_01_FULL_44_29]OGE39562.1 MAG: hypothetical protein A3E86_01945 [Candidatus Daviesbacteria bacterium RIFCSPHIGHO2_12_FULL_47_45]OGE41161.1 MAG: hypothetical protein A3D25_01355 [Candidatus Daviesbacteria bacterium RIFCSPHIGHO2_02_FULL_43_12]OGE69360.1 MAG: hypothetical protein A3B55_03095 [Candidatus Daviesbacteria bacterium RIFCSPLOWO2_01_FULL_43_15]
MKRLLRSFLINLIALRVAILILPAFNLEGGIRVLLIGAVVFMFINLLVIPLVRIMLLPLNLLTLGIFSWVASVIGLYILTLVVPQFKLMPYTYPGGNFGGLVIPSFQLNIVGVAIVSSFLIGFIVNFLKWLTKN